MRSLALIAAVSLLLSACSTLPDGWGTATPSNVIDNTAAASQFLAGVDDNPAPDAIHIMLCGSMGATAFRASAESGLDTESRIRAGVKAMLEFADASGWFDDRGLADTCRAQFEAAGTDAEVLLGLLRASLSAVPAASGELTLNADR